jgi:hypothetical protein
MNDSDRLSRVLRSARGLWRHRHEALRTRRGGRGRMILTELAGVTVYRMHVPQVGGRANRVGLNPLYLALDHDTAIREYQQLSSLLPPGT